MYFSIKIYPCIIVYYIIIILYYFCTNFFIPFKVLRADGCPNKGWDTFPRSTPLFFPDPLPRSYRAFCNQLKNLYLLSIVLVTILFPFCPYKVFWTDG